MKRYKRVRSLFAFLPDGKTYQRIIKQAVLGKTYQEVIKE